MGYIIPSKAVTTFPEIDYAETVITADEYSLSKIYPIREVSLPYLKARRLPPKELLCPGLRNFNELYVDIYGDPRNQLRFRIGNRTVGTPLTITEKSIIYQKILYKDTIASIELPWDVECDYITVESIDNVPKKYVRKVTPVKYNHLRPESVHLHTEIFWDEEGDDVWYTVLTLKIDNYTLDYIIEPRKLKIYRNDNYVGEVEGASLEEVSSIEELLDFLEF